MFKTFILPALVSIVTALLTIYFKSIRDSKAYEKKISVDHNLFEKKKIKESIAEHKTHLINSFEELNHRLWNLSHSYEEQWHFMNGNYLQDNKYYFHSFIYRLSSAVWWANKVDQDMVYLDTTISDESDLTFLKFCKFINIFICQTSLYKGLSYDESEPVDHFFRHILLMEANNLTDKDGKIINYASFEADLPTYLNGMKGICQFIDSVAPDEERYRWAKLYCLQLLLVCFLNLYGYDFQKTSEEQISKIIGFVKMHPKGSEMLKNFIEGIRKFKLDTNTEITKVISLINA